MMQAVLFVSVIPASLSVNVSTKTQSLTSSTWILRSKYLQLSPMKTRQTYLNRQYHFKTPATLASSSASSSSSSSTPQTTTTTPHNEETTKITRTTFARGETFSRRRIGIYELNREGVDPSILSKRTLKFELIYGCSVLSFITIFFIIPVVTNTPLREDIIAGIIALLMSFYAYDTLVLKSAFTSYVLAQFNDKKRVALHEAAHLLVAHLLGFRVQSAILPTPGNVWRSRINDDVFNDIGVAMGKCWAQSDVYRVSAVGLAGLASELLVYGNAYGAEDDMAQVGRQVKISVANMKNDMDDDGAIKEEDVKHILRWGLLVATRMIKQHSVAFQAVADALIQGEEAQHCIALIDQLASDDHLVKQPFDAEE